MDARTLKGIRLRHTRTSGAGFPAGREFRYVVYDGRILAHGYYWDGEDALGVLSTEERATVAELVKRGAERLNAPYVAIDVGQVESGAWTIIEVGDGQFAGHSQIPLLELWNRLREVISGAD